MSHQIQAVFLSTETPRTDISNLEAIKKIENPRRNPLAQICEIRHKKKTCCQGSKVRRKAHRWRYHRKRCFRLTTGSFTRVLIMGNEDWWANLKIALKWKVLQTLSTALCSKVTRSRRNYSEFRTRASQLKEVDSAETRIVSKRYDNKLELLHLLHHLIFQSFISYLRRIDCQGSKNLKDILRGLTDDLNIMESQLSRLLRHPMQSYYSN